MIRAIYKVCVESASAVCSFHDRSYELAYKNQTTKLVTWLDNMQLINRFKFDNLKGDLFGGLTASIVALPLALAFGVASGAGAIAGLYSY